MQAKRGENATIDSRRVVVLATGGTIAGRLVAPGGSAYRAAELGVEDLLNAIQGLPGSSIDRGAVEAEQVAQVDSKDMTHALWRALALRCQFHLARDEVAGVVVTHGTDTMEETAYFLHRVLGSTHADCKPLVLTGAMRPADATDADGPRNLSDALTLARHPGARGVLVTMGGQVHHAVHVRKAHATRIDAFTGGEAGPVAEVGAGHVTTHAGFASPSSLSNLATSVPDAWPETSRWPRVAVVMSHAGVDGACVDALVATGVRGIVVAATGNGSVHKALEDGLRRAVAAGVAVEVATRCLEPVALASSAADLWPRAEHGSPVKARIALMLRLLAAS